MSTKTAEIDSLHVSLPQMLDLALGTPEVGAVNLNILHNFLHVLLHQINLQSTKVEYRGEDANRLKTMVTSLKAGPTLYLQEYSITDGSGKTEHRGKSADAITADTFTDEKESVPSVKKTKGTRQEIGPETETERQTVIFVEPVVDGTAPTALKFKQLEKSVNQLQQQFQALEELSTNPELVERLKGKIGEPLSDMWNMININKRLDASEQGIDKLTSMVQDVFKGDAVNIPRDTSDVDTKLEKLAKDLSRLEKTVENLKIITGFTSDDATPIKQISTDAPEDTQKATPRDLHKRTDITDTTNENEISHDDAREKSSKLIEKPLKRLTADEIDLTEIHRDVAILKNEMTQLRKDINDLNKKVSHVSIEKEKITAEKPTKEKSKIPATETPVVKSDRHDDTKETDDTNLARCLQVVKTLEEIHGNALNELTERIQTLERNVSELIEKVNTGSVAVSGEEDLNELISKIQGVQTDMEKLSKTADHLVDEKESREMHLNTLLEQIELLKTIKADKEDLEDALADKADAQVVNRKVSHDQFDAACDDLARGLEEAVSKLGKQESIWQEALDEVQREIESKVDKIEMTPLKDFVNNRLKSLQQKLKSMIEEKREDEAAGTKKILRDVQCISCDKNVVMKMEEVGKFQADPLPCTISMKPYLTYELDQVRKQQRRLPHSRNMIQFEAAMQEETRKLKTAREETLVKTPRDHLCNRYCGGSHTITTPQQRVMRVGHFLSQWGPETVQLTEGLIKGTDGQLYRGRSLPGKPDVCGPCCETEISEDIKPERPPSATPRKARRTSAGSQKRISRMRTSELILKEVVTEPERPVEEPPPTEEIIEDIPPLDPTAHTDIIVRDGGEELGEEQGDE